MNAWRLVKTGGINFLKGAAVALVSFAGLIVGGMVTRAVICRPWARRPS